MPSQVLNLKTKRWSGQEISISDHEAISTTLKLNNNHQNQDWIKHLHLCQKLFIRKWLFYKTKVIGDMITWYQCKFKGLNSILIVVVIQLYVFLIMLDDNLCRCCVMVLQLSLKLTWGMLMLASLAVMRSGWSAPLPLDQEVQFPGLLGGSEDLLRLQSSGKSSRLVVSPFRESVKKNVENSTHGSDPRCTPALIVYKIKIRTQIAAPFP